MPVYAKRKELTLTCYFEPEKPAAGSAELFTRINYEGFFFCNRDELTRFQANPVEFCGLLTDPVSKQRFRPTKESVSDRHEGVRFFFESKQTANLFQANPEEYMLPGFKMEETPETTSAG